MHSSLSDKASQKSEINEAILAAAQCLFAENGIDVRRQLDVGGQRESHSDPTAIIGFAGEHVAGTLSLALPWEILERSHPAGTGEQDDLLDWLRELSNVFLGKVKVTLQRYGLPIDIGLPTSVVGERMAFHTRRDKMGFFLLELAVGEAVILYDTIIDPRFKWSAPSELPEVFASEIIMF